MWHFCLSKDPSELLPGHPSLDYIFSLIKFSEMWLRQGPGGNDERKEH